MINEQLLTRSPAKTKRLVIVFRKESRKRMRQDVVSKFIVLKRY